MRNKILVLVLALVCLFAVSALAASDNVADLIPEEHRTDISAQVSNNADGHIFYKTTAPQNWPYVYGTADYVCMSYETQKFACDGKTTVVLVCTCNECKEDGFDVKATDGSFFARKVTLTAKAVNHVVDLDVENWLGDHVEPTCERFGYVWRKCAVCGDQIKLHGDETKTDDQFYRDSLKKLSHTYTDTTDDIEVAKTCFEYGYTIKVCDVCGAEGTKTIHTEDGKLTHKMVSKEIYVTYESCAQAGQKKVIKACEYCNTPDTSAAVTYKTVAQRKHDMAAFEKLGYYELTDSKKTNASGLRYVNILAPVEKDALETIYHALEDGSYLVKEGSLTYTYVPAKCGIEGLVTISCAHCKETKQYAVAALEHEPHHDYELPKMDDCTKSYTVAFVCAHCNEFFQETLPACTEHDYREHADNLIQYKNNGSTKVVYHRAPWDTHGEDVWGIWNGNEFVEAEPAECLPYYEVYKCDCILWGDRWNDWEDEIEMWCEAEKLVEVKPEADAKHTDIPTKADGSHDKDACYKYTAATCTATGSATYACKECGETITKSIKEKAHEVSKWNIDVAPACGVEGKVSGKCKVCETPMSDTLPALKHELVLDKTLSVPVQPCIAGKNVYTCANCDEVKTEIVAAPHVEETENEKLDPKDRDDYSVYIESTCTSKGTKTFKCLACQNEVTVEIPKKEHKLQTLTADQIAASLKEHPATCSTPAYYLMTCNECKKSQPVFVGEALGHEELTKAELEYYRNLAVAGQLDPAKFIVKGTIDCENGATATMLYKESYEKWTLKDGEWTKASTLAKCEHEVSFDVPALGHSWSDEAVLDEKTGLYYVECEECGATKAAEVYKPEYDIKIDGTKGKITLKTAANTALGQAWVRISYGFELSDGSYLAMTTCMPVTFEWIDDVQVGTFSFFALNTSLESTGINYMVVDQYDAMYKSIGELVGNNYGMYIG